VFNARQRARAALVCYANFVVRHPWLILIWVVATTSILSSGLTSVALELDPDDQLPQSHPYVKTLNRLHTLFGDKNLVIIALRPTDGDAFAPHFLDKVRRITRALALLPGANASLLQSLAARNTNAAELVEDGLVVRPVIDPDRPIDFKEAAEIRRRAHSDPAFKGTLVSENSSSIAIYASFDLTHEIPGYVGLTDAVTKILEQENDQSFSYYLTGPVVIAAELSNRSSGMGRYFLLALLVIGAIHYEAFRTAQAVVLPLATGILAVVWSLGAMGLSGISIDPYNATTPILILAVAAGHAVQILKRYYEEFFIHRDQQRAIATSLVEVGTVMIAAGGIASTSFLSLIAVGTESMRVFGLFTALGIISALIHEMTTVPAVRSIMRPPSSRLEQTLTRSQRRLDKVLNSTANALCQPHLCRFVVMAYGALVLICALAAQGLTVDTSFKRNFSQEDPVRVHDDFINRAFAGSNDLIFLLEAIDDDHLITDAASVAFLDKFQKELESLPGVGKAVSVVDTIKRMHGLLGGASSTPYTRELVTQYLFLYALSGGDDLDSRVTPDHKVAKIVVLLKEDGTSFAEETIRLAFLHAERLLPDGYRLTVTGTLASNAALTEAIVRGKLLSILQIAAITVVVSALVLRSWMAGLLVVGPLALAVLANLAVMRWAGMKLDVSTAVINAMAVGVGADYAVYFLCRLREEYRHSCDFDASLARTMVSSGKAILFVASAVALGYAVLVLSGFAIFVQLGAMVGLAMLTSSVATLVFIPASAKLIQTAGKVRLLLPDGKPSVLTGRDQLRAAQ
jgi:predicted RND superfamily exporter protein